MAKKKICAFLVVLSAIGFIYRFNYKHSGIFCKPLFSIETISSKVISPEDVLRNGNGIIFIETTNRMEPRPLALCAIESAARVYHDRPVVFFMKGLTNIYAEDDMNRTRKSFPTLSSFDNLYFFPLRMEEVFKDTPLLPWFMKVNPDAEIHWIHVSSDGCRLALIWKHGGFYMDTDIISIRTIQEKDFVACELSQISGNSIFGLSPRHSFAWNSMESFVRDFNGAVWGYQGPALFTRILKKICVLPELKDVKDGLCGNISYLNPIRFYPIPSPSWKTFYQVWNKLPTFNDSYAVHLWNYGNKGTRETMVPGSNTLVEHLYQQHCPSTYRAIMRKECTHL
ncbi:alpha-1,4-N-acetylglucosaminyltransferase-like [Ascaphus truei]|uniref:alpha-1,4-N-acetylglucosaminyltransferase-like n=1 Tax=Ascaphus truei TaxID=8439 RepID=UPI003F5A0832